MPDYSKYPIFLANGIARFDFIRQEIQSQISLPDSINEPFEYFKGIKPFLEKAGFTVFHTNVTFAGSVAAAAEKLKEQILANLTDGSKCHIIAHSQGGLNARYMIAKCGMADKVKTLDTIATPHLGSEVADAIDTSLAGKFLTQSLSRFFSVAGFHDLTTESCRKFNEEIAQREADNDVNYQVYFSRKGWDKIFLPLQPGWLLINQKTGQENDGLVSITSQMWRSTLTRSDGTTKIIKQIPFPVDADHLNEVGWWSPGRFLGLTTNLLQQIRTYEDQIKQVYLSIAQNLDWD